MSPRRLAGRLCAGALLASLAVPAFSPAPPGPRRIALVNGRWFTGRGFEQRTVYIVDGVLAFRRPPSIDTTIDLELGYVVPPFGDAHNHNVEFWGEARAGAIVQKYLAAGVFYDQNPLTLARARDGMGGLVNVPTGVDVTWAVGGLTGTGGHPTGLFLRNLDAGVFTQADGEGGLFFTIDSLADLDRKWPQVVARRSDFIKVFLLYSEHYDKRRGDSAYFNWRGMNPAVLPEVVRRAHAAGLRVLAHIETAADFHTGLAAGVDEIGHLPGFRGDERGQLPDASPYVIPDSDAELAARRGAVVVTTLQGGAGRLDPAGPDSALRRTFDALHRRNLTTLQRHRVKLAIGSDNYRETSVPEAMYLHGLGVFSNLELLELWAVATPRAIFPQRKIGRLEAGYEASFLVLAGDPLADFANTTKITRRVKQGVILNP